jgi:hypothetical protein
VVLAGQLRGFGAPRVEHHQFAAAPVSALMRFFTSGHGPDAAVAGQRIGAEHQEVVAAIDVGNREQGLVSEQPQ